MPLVLTGLGAFLLLRKGAQGVVKNEVMKYRDQLYDVGPNCEITPKHQEGTDEESGRAMEQLWSEYVQPLVHDQWEAGRFLLDDLTTAVMQDLFPEKQCQWPPGAESPESQKIAFVMMRAFIAQGLACDPANPTGNLPAGQVCFEEPIEGWLTDWMVTSYGILKVVHPWYAQLFEPIIAMGSQQESIFYRAPEHLVVESDVVGA